MIVLSPYWLFLVGIITLVSGLKEDDKANGICQNFYPDVPYSSSLLPSEIPTMNCTCVGLKDGQSCPTWEFLVGSENATVLWNETNRPSRTSCTSSFHFRVSPEVVDQWDVFSFTVRCAAAEHEKTVRLLIRKSLNNYKCNEDQDCLFENQHCQVKGHCPRENCAKVCQCVDPLPIFVDGSPETCYPKIGFGEPCNYTVQCEDIKASVVCSTDHDADNGTSGVCRCPDGYTYNGRQQSCIESLPGVTQQSLTERIMIAVCCGIVGIFIFVFVSHICKRHLRHSRRRQNCQDAGQDVSFNQPLNKKPELSDKPPSYQESQQGEIPVQLVSPLRSAQTDNLPEDSGSHIPSPGPNNSTNSSAVLDPSTLQPPQGRIPAIETDF